MLNKLRVNTLKESLDDIQTHSRQVKIEYIRNTNRSMNSNAKRVEESASSARRLIKGLCAVSDFKDIDSSGVIFVVR